MKRKTKVFLFLFYFLMNDKNEETINDGSHGNDVVCRL